jgi:CheY-like chemotaxis protein
MQIDSDDKKGAILIIDDDETIRQMLKLALEMQDYTVYTAANGKDGLLELRKIPTPCIILLDLMMPEMDGWQFVNTLTSEKELSSIRIFVMTAFPEKASTLTVAGVIRKPFDLDQLFEITHEYCNSC